MTQYLKTDYAKYISDIILTIQIIWGLYINPYCGLPQLLNYPIY